MPNRPTSSTPILLADVNAASVEDGNGGIWYPGEDAQEQIAEAWDPQSEAVRICREEPMRGVWHS